ncbi:MAG: hypothetical protein ABL977_04910 [Candidatus Eisenbacteria bacterium]
MTIAILLQPPPWAGATARLDELLVIVRPWGLALLMATGVTLLGWLLAALLGRLARRLLEAMKFDEALPRLLGRHGPSRPRPSELAGWGVHWVLFGLTLLTALELLGVHLATSVVAQLADIVPRVITAAVLFAVGSLVAMLLGATVHRFLDSANVRAARLQGQVVTIVLTGFAGLLALGQLGFAAQFVMSLGIVAAASAGLALALAFGLGCRELARDFLVEYLRALDDPGPPRAP